MHRSRWRRLRVLLPALGVAGLGLAGCSSAPASVLDPAGPVAKDELNLIVFSFWIMMFVLAAVFILLGMALWKAHRQKQREGLPPQTEGNNRLEITWTVIPVIIVIALMVPSISSTFRVGVVPAQAKDFQVTVIGHQYWWEFQYPGEGIVTADELHLPVGQEVDLEITSADVMHSFWVPRLGGKVEALPGHVNQLWLKADKTGVYPGQCAQFCGTGHADMAFKVVVDTPQQYQQWVASMKQTAATPVSAQAQQGKQLFQQNCQSCHAINGVSQGAQVPVYGTEYKGSMGPNLTNFGLHTGIAGDTLPNTPANLAQWIADPQAVKPGATMPRLGLNQTQINAVAAYLEGLK